MDPDIFFNFEVVSRINNGDIASWLFVNVIGIIILTGLEIYMFLKLFCIDCKVKDLIHLYCISGVWKVFYLLFAPTPYFIIVDALFQILLYKVILEADIEECILGVTINLIVSIFLRAIFASLLMLRMQHNEIYLYEMYEFTFTKWFIPTLILAGFLMCHYICEYDIIVDLVVDMQRKTRFDICVLSLIVMGLMVFTTVKLMYTQYELSLGGYMLNMGLLTALLYIGVRNAMRIDKIKKQEMVINNLKEYTENLNSVDDGMREFRHNFANFVQALDGYASVGDITGIKKMCRDLCKECRSMNNLNGLTPKVINNPSLYSLIMYKYRRAEDYGVTMNVEVSTEVDNLNISDYHLSLILGVLLDNAIEAAKDCPTKEVNLKFVRDTLRGNKFIIVENTYINRNLDVDKIFEKGYSTKKTINESQRGIGLWNVKKIVDNCETLNLYTYKEKLFSQKLEIRTQS